MLKMCLWGGRQILMLCLLQMRPNLKLKNSMGGVICKLDIKMTTCQLEFSLCDSLQDELCL